MKQYFSDLFKKTTSIPYQYTITIAIVMVLLALALIQGSINWTFASVIIGLGVVALLQMTIGSVIIKSILSIVAILYATAMYAGFVTSIEGSIVEPFLMTIASVTAFLASTYSKKHPEYGIRSRQLWSTVLVFCLISIKLALIVNDFGVAITELVGINITIIYIVLWIYWTRKSKKTKVIEPTKVKEEIFEDFKIIYIEEELDVNKKIWKNYLASNAFPYIYKESVLAKEDKKHLIIVSKAKSNRVFEMDSVKIHKSKFLHYVYLEDKDNKYLQDTILKFSEELKLKGI